MNRAKRKRIVLAACVFIVIACIVGLTLRKDPPPPTVVGNIAPAEAAEIAHTAWDIMRRNYKQHFADYLFDKDLKGAGRMVSHYRKIQLVKIELRGTNECLVTFARDTNQAWDFRRLVKHSNGWVDAGYHF